MKRPSREARGLGLAKRVLFSLAILVAALILVEIGFRALARRLGVDPVAVGRFRDFVWTGKSPYFEPRAFVSFVHRAGLPGVTSQGFVSADYPVERGPSTLRIACLGGSTTESLTAEGLAGTYPSLLEGYIRKSGRTDAQVMSFGMPAWTTAETMVNYFIRVQDYAPDIVILHHAVNDVAARMWPGYRDDYSHFRIPWREPRFGLLYRVIVRASDLAAWIETRRLGGVDVTTFVDRHVERSLVERPIAPETSRAFRRNVRTVCRHVRLEGGFPVLVTMPYDLDATAYENHKRGIEEHNEILRDLAKEEEFLLVDAAADARERWLAWKPQFVDIVHLTKEGNRRKAALIVRALAGAGLLDTAARRK